MFIRADAGTKLFAVGELSKRGTATDIFFTAMHDNIYSKDFCNMAHTALVLKVQRLKKILQASSEITLTFCCLVRVLLCLETSLKDRSGSVFITDRLPIYALFVWDSYHIILHLLSKNKVPGELSAALSDSSGKTQSFIASLCLVHVFFRYERTAPMS